MNPVKAVVFDLDGVVVSTDELHFQAWKAIAEAEDIPFSRQDNERLRGVSREQSLEILLERAARSYTDEEKTTLTDLKNRIYVGLLSQLTPRDVLPGVVSLLRILKAKGVLTAIGSSSRNAKRILEAIELRQAFDAVADGHEVTRSKPHPDIFLAAARKLGLDPEDCLVIEDAVSGVEAARAAGMRVVGVGPAAAHPGVLRGLASLLEWDEALLR